MGELTEQLKTDLKHGQGRYSSPMGIATLPFDYVAGSVVDNLVAPAVRGFRYLTGSTPSTTETEQPTLTRLKPNQTYNNKYIADINNWALDNPDRVFGNDFVTLRLYLTPETWEYISQGLSSRDADRYYKLGILPSNIYSKFFNRSINEALHNFAEHNVLPALEIAAGEAVGTAGKELMYAASGATGIGRNYLAARAVRLGLRGKPDFNMLATSGYVSGRQPAKYNFNLMDDFFSSTKPKSQTDDFFSPTRFSRSLQVDNGEQLVEALMAGKKYPMNYPQNDAILRQHATDYLNWRNARLNDGRLQRAIDDIVAAGDNMNIDPFGANAEDAADRLLAYNTTKNNPGLYTQDFIANANNKSIDRVKMYLADDLEASGGLAFYAYPDATTPNLDHVLAMPRRDVMPTSTGYKLSNAGYNSIGHEGGHALFHNENPYVRGFIQRRAETLPGIYNYDKNLAYELFGDDMQYALDPNEIISYVTGGSYEAFKRGIPFTKYLQTHADGILQALSELFGPEKLAEWDKLIIKNNRDNINIPYRFDGTITIPNNDKV